MIGFEMLLRDLLLDLLSEILIRDLHSFCHHPCRQILTLNGSLSGLLVQVIGYGSLIWSDLLCHCLREILSGYGTWIGIETWIEI